MNECKTAVIYSEIVFDVFQLFVVRSYKKQSIPLPTLTSVYSRHLQRIYAHCLQDMVLLD